MSLRLALVGACLLAFAAPAAATTTRTTNTPEQIRAFHTSGGAYDKALAKTYANATKYVKGQLGKNARKPAVVLDIDETAMSNYACLDAVDFNLTGLATCVAGGKSVAIAPALKFYRAVRAKHVSVFFVTGAPQGLCNSRKANLAAQGFTGKIAITCRPDNYQDASLVPYKSGARKVIKNKGFTILANVGDQQSDLKGGFARKTFKLANDIYITT